MKDRHLSCESEYIIKHIQPLEMITAFANLVKTGPREIDISYSYASNSETRIWGTIKEDGKIDLKIQHFSNNPTTYKGYIDREGNFKINITYASNPSTTIKGKI